MLLLLIGYVTIAIRPAVDAGLQVFTAIRRVEAAEKLHPDDPTAEVELAYNLLVADQRLLFAETVEKAGATYPGLPQMFYLEGRFKLAHEDPRGAIGSLQKALELAPENLEARCYLAAALRDVGESQAAKAQLQQVTRTATYSWPFRALAEIDLDSNQRQAALTFAKRALALDPQSTDNLLIAGKVYEALGRREEAIAMYQRAEKLDPLADAPHYRLFKLYAGRPLSAGEAKKEAELFDRLRQKDTPRPREKESAFQPPNGSPQARSREEFDEFGLVVQAGDTLSRIRMGEQFAARFPKSEFREKVLELELEAFRERNDYRAVKRVARGILRLNPGNASVLADLALTIANQNDATEFTVAKQYADRAMESAASTSRPVRLSRADFFAWKDTVLATAESAQGVLALRRGDAKRAEGLLTRAINLRPVPSGADFLRLGEARRMRDEITLSKEAFSRAEGLGPAAVAERARAEISREEVLKLDAKPVALAATTKSISDYRKFIQDHPDTAEAHHNLGLAYYRAHEYASAQNSLKKALSLRSDLAGTELFLGLSEFRLGEFRESARHLEAALRTEPNNREATLALIRDQMATGHLDLKAARVAMERLPNDTELNYAIGLACLNRIREIAFAATELGPESSPSLWLRFRKAENAGDIRGASKLRERIAGTTEPEQVVEYDSVSLLLRKAFEAVLTDAPDSNAAHSIQGYLLESTGKLDAALVEYRQAADHFAAGRLLAQNVRLNEAETEFEAAVAVDPENDRARADLGRLYVQKNEPAKAAGVLQDLVRKYPSDPYAWADFGKAESALGNYAVAIQCLRTALDLNPDLNQLHYQLASLYRKQGREDLTSSELSTFQSNRSKHP